MVSIQHAIRMVKDDLANLLEAESIFNHCRTAGHTWRMSRLNPAVLIHLFVMQILNRNTACSHLRHLSGLSFTASAYCQARMRLPLAVIRLLVGHVCQLVGAVCDDEGRWFGHRVWRVDGSSVSMPDTPALQKQFGQPGQQTPGCGFPVASILVLMHAGTGLLMDLIVRPLRVHEMSGIARLHKRLRPGDVIVGDRGFCSYAHLSLVLQGKMHAVLRLHQRIIVSFTPGRLCRAQLPKKQRKGQPGSRYVRRLGRNDQIVIYFKKHSPKSNWMSQAQYDAMPDQIEVRELSYRIKRKGFRTRQVTLVTTLTDPHQYPQEKLAQLYGERWQIEVDLRHLKITLGMDVLHCKTVDGVMKELWMFVLVYNLVRLVMLKTALRQGVDVDRISFVDALRWLCNRQPTDYVCLLMVNPLRSDRIEPRVLKRRRKEYSLMRKPRHELRQALLESQLAD
jgi:hypothetical protein